MPPCQLKMKGGGQARNIPWWAKNRRHEMIQEGSKPTQGLAVVVCLAVEFLSRREIAGVMGGGLVRSRNRADSEASAWSLNYHSSFHGSGRCSQPICSQPL
jgi:hypothetical protein